MLLFAGMMAASVASASAQGPRTDLPEPATVRLFQSDALARRSATAGIIGSGADDYRYTGMYVGLGFAAVAGVLGTIMCTDQDSTCNEGDLALGITALAVVAGTVGAMIGHAFPKHSPPATSAPGLE